MFKHGTGRLSVVRRSRTISCAAAQYSLCWDPMKHGHFRSRWVTLSLICPSLPIVREPGHTHTHTHNKNRENKNRARKAVKENSSGTTELS